MGHGRGARAHDSLLGVESCRENAVEDRSNAYHTVAGQRAWAGCGLEQAWPRSRLTAELEQRWHGRFLPEQRELRPWRLGVTLT
jgi:hypothetical protein